MHACLVYLNPPSTCWALHRMIKPIHKFFPNRHAYLSRTQCPVPGQTQSRHPRNAVLQVLELAPALSAPTLQAIHHTTPHNLLPYLPPTHSPQKPKIPPQNSSQSPPSTITHPPTSHFTPPTPPSQVTHTLNPLNPCPTYPPCSYSLHDNRRSPHLTSLHHPPLQPYRIQATGSGSGSGHTQQLQPKL